MAGWSQKVTHTKQTAHIEDFIKGRKKGIQSVPLGIREKERKGEEERRKEEMGKGKRGGADVTS